MIKYLGLLLPISIPIIIGLILNKKYSDTIKLFCSIIIHVVSYVISYKFINIIKFYFDLSGHTMVGATAILYYFEYFS